MHGDRDHLFPIDIATTMYEAIPRSYLWVIPNGTHSPYFDGHADAINTAALAFLSGAWHIVKRTGRRSGSRSRLPVGPTGSRLGEISAQVDQVRSVVLGTRLPLIALQSVGGGPLTPRLADCMAWSQSMTGLRTGIADGMWQPSRHRCMPVSGGLVAITVGRDVQESAVLSSAGRPSSFESFCLDDPYGWAGLAGSLDDAIEVCSESFRHLLAGQVGVR